MATKKSIKRSNTPKQKSSNISSFKLRPWHVLAAITLFVVGGFVIAFSRAATKPKAPPTSLVSIAYYDSVPVIENNDGGTVSFTQAPRSIEIDASGQIFCMPSQGNEGTTRQLTAAELGRIRDISEQALQKSTNLPAEEATVSARTLFVTRAGQTRPEAVSYANTTSRPANFERAINTLEQACANAPGQKIQRPNKPKMKDTNPTTSQDTQVYTPLSRYLNPVGVAYAASGPLRETAFSLITLVNQQRTRYGLSALPIEGCLNEGAEKITLWNATSGILVHTIDLGGSLGTACQPYWKKLGENISKSSTADLNETMFRVCLPLSAPTSCLTPADPNTIDYRTVNQDGVSYMASPGHRSNILGSWHRIGAGAYMSTNNSLFTATWFMLCTVNSNKQPVCTATK